MAIKKVKDLDFTNKTFTMIISGSPGLGKSTLALSAPKPLWIDVDRGIDRVREFHRQQYTQPETYEELLEDLTSDEYKDCETVVIDTAGSLIQLMQPWAKKQDAKAAKDGRAMFGIIKREFDRLIWQIRNDHKNIVIIFHTTEMQKGDIITTRLSCEGSAKDIVWTSADFGGHMFMQGEKRMIGFTPTEEYFAKGCNGVQGLWKIPEIVDKNGSIKAPNTFLTELFEKARRELIAGAVRYNEQKSFYDEVICNIEPLIKAIKTPEDAQKATEAIKASSHSLTSAEELRQMLMNKIKQEGIVWNKEEKKYEMQ